MVHKERDHVLQFLSSNCLEFHYVVTWLKVSDIQTFTYFITYKLFNFLKHPLEVLLKLRQTNECTIKDMVDLFWPQQLHQYIITSQDDPGYLDFRRFSTQQKLRRRYIAQQLNTAQAIKSSSHVAWKYLKHFGSLACLLRLRDQIFATICHISRKLSWNTFRIAIGRREKMMISHFISPVIPLRRFFWY